MNRRSKVAFDPGLQHIFSRKDEVLSENILDIIEPYPKNITVLALVSQWVFNHLPPMILHSSKYIWSSYEFLQWDCQEERRSHGPREFQWPIKLPQSHILSTQYFPAKNWPYPDQYIGFKCQMLYRKWKHEWTLSIKGKIWDLARPKHLVMTIPGLIQLTPAVPIQWNWTRSASRTTSMSWIHHFSTHLYTDTNLHVPTTLCFNILSPRQCHAEAILSRTTHLYLPQHNN